MLELHLSANNYCMLFEFHDDVVVLDDDLNPTAADFYQIKTTTTTWTVHALCKQETGKNGSLPSLLGKLYDHHTRFPGKVRKLTFVAVSPFDIKMKADPKCDARESFCLCDSHTDERSKVDTNLSKEFGLPMPLDGLDKLHFEASPLSLLDHETHTVGVITNFLESRGIDVSPMPFYRTIRAAVQKRSTKEGAETTFTETTRSRGLTRTDVDACLNSIMNLNQQTDLIDSIRGHLTAETFNIRQSHAIISNLRTYLTERCDQTNLVLVNAAERAALEINRYVGSQNSATPLADVLTHLEQVRSKEFDRVRTNYSNVYLQALFLATFYEQALPSSSSQPSEESP